MLLNLAESYFRDIIAPQASILDQNSELLKKALQGMGDRNLLALRVPPKWGGVGVEEITYRKWQIMIARYSGALAFLQTQHQSAGSHLAASHNQVLKQEYLPLMGSGKILMGVGYSQLRRAGEPLMKAIPVDGGYLLSGTVPWITGFGFFDYFIIGATLGDEQVIYGLVPFQDMKQTQGGSISFSKPMELVVMSSTRTVEGILNQWFLADDYVLSVKPLATVHENDQKNVLHHGFFALGCAYAGLDILESVYQRKKLSAIDEVFQDLKPEINNCHQAMISQLSEPEFCFEERLKLRAWAIKLALNCSQAAVVASSGVANVLSHPAGRVYREALQFSVSGQTTDVMKATLDFFQKF